MSCYHPLKAFVVGKNPSGKDNLMVCAYGVHHLERRNGHIMKIDSDFVSPYAEQVFLNWKEIPCGHCDGCRIDRSRDWANRCMLEMQYHTDAWFVTLTYNDEHLPLAYAVDETTGEAREVATLSKRDWQLFMKRLRKITGQELRFFMCGEYGPKTYRPHYHAIIYGLKLDDVQFFSQRMLGKKIYTYYQSVTLQNAWSVLECDCKGERQRNPIGHVLLGKVTWETCAYVARYCLKKAYGSDGDILKKYGVTPEFVLMSRRPGIARQWFDEHPECYEYDFINICTPDGGKKVRPPKYFDRLFDAESPEVMADLKKKRQRFAEEQKNARLASTSLSYTEYLSVQEENFKNRIKVLKKRDLL